MAKSHEGLRPETNHQPANDLVFPEDWKHGAVSSQVFWEYVRSHGLIPVYFPSFLIQTPVKSTLPAFVMAAFSCAPSLHGTKTELMVLLAGWSFGVAMVAGKKAKVFRFFSQLTGAKRKERGMIYN